MNDNDEDNVEEVEPKKEPLSFEEWLSTSSFHENQHVLPDVDEWSVGEIIQHYQEEFEVPDEWLSIVYTNLENNEQYNHRENEIFIAASTTKVLIAMIYLDLIESGEISLETPIPYAPSMYQEGAGQLTEDIQAGLEEESYPLEVVLEDLLVPSGNIPRQMLVAYYEAHFGNLSEKMAQLLQNVDYSAELFDVNQITAKALEEGLLLLLEKESYQLILEFMRQADEERFFKFYAAPDMPVKHGSLRELRHQIGIYEVEGTPMYTLVFMTRNLYDDLGDEFLGKINLQLAVQAEYQYYVDHFEEM